MQIKSTFLE